MYDFKYTKPSNLADAVQALKNDDTAKPIAGGMTFIPVLKQRLNNPSAVIDLSGLGLSWIKRENDKLIIGAMTPHAVVAASPDVKKTCPAVAYLAGNIGDRQVRYRGTIGGSLANNDPSACYPSAALALDATIETDRRMIPSEAFFQGMFTTALESDEIITAVHFPFVECAAYMKFPNPASRYAMVGVFVAKTKFGVRVAVTGAGQNGVFRHKVFEDVLNHSFVPSALDGLQTAAEDLNGDIHGSAEYRAHLVSIMAKRAVMAAVI
jgi:aerobic carbon-monoxide dehydrogenase medium subunit